MRASDLPDFLDMHQALAWVRYRDPAFTLTADADNLWAEKLYGSRSAQAGQEDLRQALVNERLVAFGAMKGTGWIALPAPEWLDLDIAPRDPARLKPYLAIRLKRDDLLKCFPISGAPERRRGRTKGSGSFDQTDVPLLDEMAALIKSGKAASSDGAARMVADRATGGGTFESKATRLAKRYRASQREQAKDTPQ